MLHAGLRSLRLAIILIVTAGATRLVVAESPAWPRFHGPKGDNISTETGLLKQWPEGGPKLLWTSEKLGEGFAGVTIGDGLVFTDGNLDDTTVITALDLAGKVRWQVPAGPAWTKSYPGTRGTPTFDGERLYHESPMGELVCLKTATGEKLWGINILAKFGGHNIQWALAESVLIDGDRLICSPGGKENALVALNKLTGETIWKSGSVDEATGYASPALAKMGSLRMLLTLTAKSVIAVNADNGELLWRFPKPTKYDVNVTSPIYHDGQVFVSTGYGAGGVMLKVKADGKTATAEKLWDTKEMDNHHGGVLLLDGYLYGSAHNQNSAKWVCLDWATGDKKWVAQGVGKGSATYADGLLYMLSENSRVGLAKISPEGMKVVSEFRLPKGGQGPTWAHPVVCGKRLYLRHGDFLYVYDIGAK
jgi:outer membrane protein assembly factor BamB